MTQSMRRFAYSARQLVGGEEYHARRLGKQHANLPCFPGSRHRVVWVDRDVQPTPLCFSACGDDAAIA